MPATEPIVSDRLVLTPLVVADAGEMVAVLSDPDLYAFTGGEPPGLDELREQYRYQTAGSPRVDEEWHNWIVRLEGLAVGYVQATVSRGAADLAWVVGSRWQGMGYATESSRAMRDWLADLGVVRFSAHIHPDHAASEAVAANLGLRPTGRIDDEGEMIWG
jgi:RimJ/RimL family protein N-acetyltransferase